MDQQLAAFIDHARAKGMDHATIRMLLLSAGWKEKDIARALTAQALDVPVPTPPDLGGAREAFMLVLTFAALYTAVSYALTLIFSYVDLKLPDLATTPYAQLQSEADRAVIPVAMAAVFVAFPLMIWLSSTLLREMRAMPDKARSPLRRQLTYLTLFLAAGMMAVDVIMLVAYLLQGELSTRFLLKVAAVLIVGGACFTYYLKSLKMSHDQMQKTTFHRWFGWSTSIIVAASLIGGLFVVGPPATERLRRFDAQRVGDIKIISEEVFNVSVGPAWRNPATPLTLKQPLPRSLDEVLAAARQRRPRISDPKTGTAYEYQVLGESTFRVCATFEQARDEAGDVAWNHPAGRRCFDFDALNPRR
ncbi:MAG: DUF5671 domain-containing protein [Acidobacteria bacterium]|nr:DUF5671 domain-containing protein [Acidobacteriota bacterium]